ncbi:SCP2 sterol-binding domain-containing protein [candidate division KSB1 bacterium]|nr:SCP2 sterol-binding domain-containing protein [candidate division KSB1 bacterium]
MAIESVDQLFESILPEKLKQINIPENLNIKVQFKIEKDQNWYLLVNKGQCDISRGFYQDPELTVEVSERNFLKLVNREMNPQMAVFTGKVRLKGDLRILTKIQSLDFF